VVDIRDHEAPDRNDVVVDAAALDDGSGRPSLALRAASVRGRSHRNGGKTRQDEYAFRRSEDGRYLVIAVADGVSAGEHSHHAANVAARRGCVLVEGWLRQYPPAAVPWEQVLRALQDAIQEQGRRALARREIDTTGWGTREFAQELATTLILGVVEVAANKGEHAVTLMRVGDVSAWTRRLDGTWCNHHDVKNDGQVIASSATSALPHVSATEPYVSTVLRKGEALVLMTDGIGDPLGNGDNDFGDFLAEMWKAPPPALAYAAHVDFARRSFDDDRTAVTVWPV
jgi:serine/threonine protein phosphatase PrpC